MQNVDRAGKFLPDDMPAGVIRIDGAGERGPSRSQMRQIAREFGGFTFSRGTGGWYDSAKDTSIVEDNWSITVAIAGPVSVAGLEGMAAQIVDILRPRLINDCQQAVAVTISRAESFYVMGV